MSPFKSNANHIMGNGYPLGLRAGVKVGPRDRFSEFGIMAWARGTGRSANTFFRGAWVNDGKGLSNRYLGLELVIKGRVHYGWARVSVSKFRFTATLTGYAYETIPGTAIIAGATKEPDDTEPTASLKTPTPEPGTLGMMALAPGLAIWRREDPAVRYI